MCLAIPGKVISISGETAIVDYGGVKKDANISLIDCSIGDYVLVHVGFAIQIVDEEKARATYSLLSDLDRIDSDSNIVSDNNIASDNTADAYNGGSDDQ